MAPFARVSCGRTRIRRALAPVAALAALALTGVSAGAVPLLLQPKPQLAVEAERSPQGARLTFKGKGWMPSARLKLTGTRAPGATGTQDFGMYTADSSGVLQGRKIVACSTSSMEDGSLEQVTITAADSASGAKATAKVQGGAWVCQ